MRLIALCCVLVGVAWACGGNIASDGSSSTTSTVGGANSVSQLGPTVCKSGNHCGVELLVESGPYHPGDTLNVYWFNFSSNTAIVNDCGNPDVQQLQESSVTYFVVASPLPCASNSVMTLAPGAQVSTTVNVPTGVGGGFFRVHGTYYLECPAGTSSPAACGSSPIDVSSNFDVYSQ